MKSVGEYGTKVVVQKDNVKPLVLIDDPAVVAASKADAWKIELRSQPANFPDLNVLDLVFFASLQSLQTKNIVHTTTKLVANIEEAF